MRPTSPAPRRAAAGLDAPASGRSLQPAVHGPASPTLSRTGQSFTAGRAAAPGRGAAPTLPRTPPPPHRRRQALVLAAVLAVLVAAGSAYAVVNSPRDKTVDALPTTAASHPVATLYSSRVPRTTAPTTSLPIPASTSPSQSPSPSEPASASPKPTVTLTFADAVSRLRTAVQSGASGGQIRGDVATDLLNLIQPLDNPDAANVNSQVENIRQKIEDRAGEGSISAAQAAVLRTRLADLARVAGM
jgi:serine/threonine-protein kinase